MELLTPITITLAASEGGIPHKTDLTILFVCLCVFFTKKLQKKKGKNHQQILQSIPHFVNHETE